MVPGGIASAATSTSGTSRKRAPRPIALTVAGTAASTRNVRCVPIASIAHSETKNTPTSEPTVEIAYSRPATTPDSSTAASFSRVAHGETAPSSSSGTATSTSVPNSEAVNAPTLMFSNALTESVRNGCEMNGHDRQQHAPAQHQRRQRAPLRPPVGEPPAEPVADRQRQQHDRDRVRPDHRRGTEERRHQALGGDLRAQRAHADREDECLQRQRAALAPGSTSAPSRD